MDITLTLFPDEDEDLLDWFSTLPAGQRAIQVKRALRQGGVSSYQQVTQEEDLIDDEAFAAMLGAL